MKKLIGKILIVLMCSFAFVNCGSDDASSTCTDSIQNGEETGVDCGGPVCDPCFEIMEEEEVVEEIEEIVEEVVE